MKRRCFTTLATLGLLLFLALPAQAASLAGLWEIQGTPDGAPAPAFTNLARLEKDGGLVNIDPWFGTGLGNWEKAGAKDYAVSFTHYFLDAGAVGAVQVDATMSLGEGGETVTGTFLTTISIGGFPVDSVTGTVVGTRQ